MGAQPKTYPNSGLEVDVEVSELGFRPGSACDTVSQPTPEYSALQDGSFSKLGVLGTPKICKDWKGTFGSPY